MSLDNLHKLYDVFKNVKGMIIDVKLKSINHCFYIIDDIGIKFTKSIVTITEIDNDCTRNLVLFGKVFDVDKWVEKTIDMKEVVEFNVPTEFQENLLKIFIEGEHKNDKRRSKHGMGKK
jgi:hypothetical protein